MSVERENAKDELRRAVENGEMDDEEFTREAEAIGLTDAEIDEMFS